MPDARSWEEKLNQLGLFAKYWQPGKVKTRLARIIGDERASHLYRLFLNHLLGQLSVERIPACDRFNIVFSPAGRRTEFQQTLPSGWSLVPQVGGDLGRRMSAFFEYALKTGKGDSRAVVIGSDTPHLSADRVELAFEMLLNHDVVFGPSTDGGYYLIGIKGEVAPVFSGINWSTSAVLQQSLDLAETVGKSVGLLPEMTDIDDLDDLRALVTLLRSQGSSLESHGLLAKLTQVAGDLFAGN